MNCRRRHVIPSLLTLVAAVALHVPRAEADTFGAYSEITAHYLNQRDALAPMVPPLLLSSLDTLEAMILKGDYSFQEADNWYFPWRDASHQASGDLAEYDGATLVIYEDLATSSIIIRSMDGKVLASSKSPVFPDLAALTGDAYDRALLAELNKRSIALAISFKVDESESTGGGAIAMSMGGEYALEVIEFEQTNTGMLVTFAWPDGEFTNRLDIYSCEASNYSGLGSWRLADVGYSTAGTNQLVWLDFGQSGRGSPHASDARLYTAGKGGDVDSDNDGYSDAFEHLSVDSDPNDADTDDDGVSDGPFDPDDTGQIVAGPDAFPHDPDEWLDTDGDGIGDNADTDDDGDGITDANDPDPLFPGIVAPLKVVFVESASPTNGTDSGTEAFDVSSAGRMLPYAVGGDSTGGYGRINGGIYLNHDGTNLYVGVAGYSKQEQGDGQDALLLLIDSRSGGVSSLSAISSGPAALSIADNLNFGTNFLVDVAAIVGGKQHDGKNNATATVGAETYGQGVYALSGSSAADLSPAFTSSGPSPISQWGDSPFAPTLANAGIEIAIPLEDILDETWSPESAAFIRVAAIVIGGATAPNRHLSKECYGESVTGSFGFASTTLTGAKVFLSPNPAPEPETAPLFGDSDVMLQGYFWKVARVALSNNSTVALAGTFNGWSTTANPMSLVGHYTWECMRTFTNATGVEFKFAADGGTQWWGDNTNGTWAVPGTNIALSMPGSDVTLAGTVTGTVRFRAYLNGDSSNFSVEHVPATNATKLLQGFSTNFWYEDLTRLVQSNRLSRFTKVWMPPPSKCNSGVDSVGYDIFDHYDLGTYPEKFSTATRYGTESQLKACVGSMVDRGMMPVVDFVLNHMNGGYAREGGSGRYNFQPEYHETFEKPDPGNNSNRLFTVNYANYPFQQDWGFGQEVAAWDGSATSADVNELNPYMRIGLKNWANWTLAKAGYRGCRFDFTQGLQPWFVSEVMNYGLMKGRFAVMEYWEQPADASRRENQTWLNLTDNRATLFDMPLHLQLKEMCNDNGGFDMQALSVSNLVTLVPNRTVTFVESHDSIRPYGDDGKTGITKDKQMAYAFILTADGMPMVAYNDYFIGPYYDPNPPSDPVDDGWTGTPLTNEINALIDVRTRFAGGTTTYLSTANKQDLYIAKRNGTDTKPGCILVLNDHPSSPLSDSVNTGWISTSLVDALQTNVTVETDDNGFATLSAPARGFRVFVRGGDL